MLEETLPSLDHMQKDFAAVFVDSGFLADERGIVLKLSMLVREPSSSGVKERLFHPYLPLKREGGSGPEPLAVFVGSSSSDNEKLKWPLSYLIELSSLLAIAKNPQMVLEGTYDRLFLVRHGPLLQLISQYLGRTYLVERELAQRALTYAGLEDDYAKTLIERSTSCEDEKRVIMGMLIFNVLIEIAKEAKKNPFIGIVEDVSESKVLFTRMLAQTVRKILVEGENRGRGPEGREEGREEVIRQLYKEIKGKKPLFDLCSCYDAINGLNEDSFVDYWKEVIEVIDDRFFAIYMNHIPTYPKLEEVEATLIWHSLPVDVRDVNLFYEVFYLSDENKAPISKPQSHAARAEVFSLRINTFKKDYLKCFSEIDKWKLISDGKKHLSKLQYQYIAPLTSWKSLKCSEISKELPIPVKPCELTGSLQVPYPIRLEFFDESPVEEMRSLVYYSSLIALYSYPPQVLLTDRFSRVTLEEFSGVVPLLELLSRRVRPYSFFVHKWLNRKLFI